MKTKIVFSDERVPGIEIWNHQSPTFSVVQVGWTNINEFHCFTHYQDKTTNDVSIEFAKKVAQEHFDELADGTTIMVDRTNRGIL